MLGAAICRRPTGRAEQQGAPCSVAVEAMLLKGPQCAGIEIGSDRRLRGARSRPRLHVPRKKMTPAGKWIALIGSLLGSIQHALVASAVESSSQTRGQGTEGRAVERHVGHAVGGGGRGSMYMRVPDIPPQPGRCWSEPNMPSLPLMAHPQGWAAGWWQRYSEAATALRLMAGMAVLQQETGRHACMTIAWLQQSAVGLH